MANTLKTALPNLTENDFRYGNHGVTSLDIELEDGTKFNIPLSKCRIIPRDEENFYDLISYRPKEHHKYVLQWDNEKIHHLDWTGDRLFANFTCEKIISLKPNFGKKKLSVEVSGGKYVISENGVPVYEIPVWQMTEFMVK